jgi:GTP-binding protein HflX
MTNQLLWFSKLTPLLTIDEDDLMTEKKHHTLRLKSGNLLWWVVEENVYFGNKTREFEEFRERVYEAVRHIHVTLSLQ